MLRLQKRTYASITLRNILTIPMTVTVSNNQRESDAKKGSGACRDSERSTCSSDFVSNSAWAIAAAPDRMQPYRPL